MPMLENRMKIDDNGGNNIMKEFNPKVSIIIPVYNGSNYMREAIDSVLAQTYVNIEVLVINDGSDDNGETERIALSYGDKIRYFSKTNGGVATALNLGIREMEGEYFSWLSHDDIYRPKKIEEQVKMLRNYDDKTIVIYSGWAIIDDKSKEFHRVIPTDRYAEEQLRRPLFPLLHGMISGCCLLIHKSHFERVGMFNEKLPLTQDFDLWFRMMRSKMTLCFPEVLTMTRVHEQQGSKKHNQNFSEEGDNLWLYIMKSLSKKEVSDIEDSEYLFFKNIYLHLFLYTSYEKSQNYAKKKLYSSFKKESREWSFVKRLNERISLVGLGQKAILKEFLSSLWRDGVINTVKRTKYALVRVVRKLRKGRYHHYG